MLSVLSVIPMPEDTVCLKAFSIAEALHAFSWSSSSKQLCFNQISGGGLVEKECLSLPNAKLIEIKNFKNRKDSLYFEFNGKNYYFHPDSSFIELESKPIQFNSVGALLENMKTFSEKEKKVENKIYIPSSREETAVLV